MNNKWPDNDMYVQRLNININMISFYIDILIKQINTNET